MSVALAALLMAQAASALPTLEQDRLTACQEEARRDPASAIATASNWLGEAQGAGRSAPQQCLGLAFTSLLRWDAAQDAFLAARAALPVGQAQDRARLAAMAGNAALAGGAAEAALAAFALGVDDARTTNDAPLMGSIEGDRARALVALEREDEAAAALAAARRDAPQDATVWLLSATLARRQDRIEEALGHVRTAAALAPGDPSVGLEAGLIAALTGQDDAARSSWNAVLSAAPGSPQAATARTYLAQLDSAQMEGPQQ